MIHPFDVLTLDNNAKLIFTPCPGTKEVDLKTSLTQLAAAGARAILTLMPREEMQRNGVTDMPDICAGLNLEWFHLPIEDEHAPEQEFNTAWKTAKSNIHGLLDAGQTIAIHCKGGSGRTGLMAAQILLERRMPLDETITCIRKLRPNALQMNVHQNYLRNLAQHLLSSGQ